MAGTSAGRCNLPGHYFGTCYELRNVLDDCKNRGVLPAHVFNAKLH